MMAGNFLKPASLILTALAFFLSCDSKAPVITSISPKTGRTGETITLTGKNFGSSHDESYVIIAGISPTGSSYYLWQDDLIALKVPDMGESGLVYVHARGKKSNGVLFSNSASVPKPVEGEDLGIGPRIISVNPQTGAPGALITITGNNFGISRESSPNGGGVFFSWDYESPSYNPYAVREAEFIEVSETEMGYASWNTREIQVRLPDGAITGNIEVRTPHGISRPFFFEVSGKPGSKKLINKRSYTVSYSVDVRVLEATRPNTLYLWMPLPVTSSSQKNISLISRSTNPFIENHKGVSLFKLDNIGAGSNHSINLSFRADVYAVQTEINHLYIKRETSPLSTTYVQKSALIPSDNQQIVSAVNTIVGAEQNPYIKARLIYNWIIENIQITHTAPPSPVTAVIERKQADIYTAALLYTTMMRAAAIPCIPAAGVLVNANGQTQRHYWTEFWIDSFGWVPVDPALGSGLVPEGFEAKEDYAGYYFGNLDNQRITFSRGELNLSQMESRGRIVSHNQSYSLQNIWEEASGGLESYTSLWGDVTITGIYVQ